jgi:hypothetical protein
VQIAASIREAGFANPVLLDGENGIVACHAHALLIAWGLRPFARLRDAELGPRADSGLSLPAVTSTSAPSATRCATASWTGSAISALAANRRWASRRRVVWPAPRVT